MMVVITFRERNDLIMAGISSDKAKRLCELKDQLSKMEDALKVSDESYVQNQRILAEVYSDEELRRMVLSGERTQAQVDEYIHQRDALELLVSTAPHIRKTAMQHIITLKAQIYDLELAIAAETPKYVGGNHPPLRTLTIIAFIAIIMFGSCLFFMNNNYRNGIDAMDNMNFIAAKRYFDNIPYANEFFSSEYSYIEAGFLMEQGQYLDALTAFDRLNDTPISAAVIEQLASKIVDEVNPFDALPAVKEVSNIQFPESSIKAITEKAYVTAQSEYRNGDFTAAKEHFQLIGSYKRSKDYLFLINRKKSPNLTKMTDREIVDKLVSLLEFEDADEIIIRDSDLLTCFLQDRWEESGTYRYFEMDEKYSCRYNLPTVYSSGSFYYLKDGIYSFGNSKSDAIEQFRFSIIDSNTISVYCYKDNSTYVLHRK